MLSVLFIQALYAGLAVLAILAFQGKRWAFVGLIALIIVSYPIRSHFYLAYRPCEIGFDTALAIYSLQNYGRMILFFACFLMVAEQLPMTRPRDYAIAIAITLIVGAIVELSEGLWGRGNCRLRDLLPAAAGALIAAGVVGVRSRRRYGGP